MALTVQKQQNESLLSSFNLIAGDIMSDGVNEEHRETEDYQKHLDSGGCPCGYWQCQGDCDES